MKDVQSWFVDELGDPLLTAKKYDDDKKKHFNPQKDDWERNELVEMYRIMRDIFKDCCCKGDHTNAISKRINERLNAYDQMYPPNRFAPDPGSNDNA